MYLRSWFLLVSPKFFSLNIPTALSFSTFLAFILYTVFMTQLTTGLLLSSCTKAFSYNTWSPEELFFLGTYCLLVFSPLPTTFQRPVSFWAPRYLKRCEEVLSQLQLVHWPSIYWNRHKMGFYSSLTDRTVFKTILLQESKDT